MSIKPQDIILRKSFGSRLKEMRLKANISHKEIGDLIGVSDSSIRKYESSDRTPTPDAIITLAEFFGITTDYLLGKEAINVSAEDLDLLEQIKKASTDKKRVIKLILDLEEKVKAGTQ